MISNAILSLLTDWIIGVMKLFGNTIVTPNPWFTNSVSTTNTYIAIVYGIIPLTIIALLVALGILIVFELAYGAYRVVKWGYTKIPGIT
jgi:hypothetical protein